jgi:hypothetical protein
VKNRAKTKMEKEGFTVTTKFVFNGVFIVKAESEKEAKKAVQNHCGLTIGEIHSSLSQEDVDWEFDMKPEKVVEQIKKV